MSLAAIQTAIYSALTGDATLMTMVVGVYDHVPQDTAGDYITVGDDITEEAGTKTEDMRRFTCTIHVWVDKRGRKRCKEIQERARTLLHNVALTPSTGTVIQIYEEFSQSFIDEDNTTYHGVQRFACLFQS